MNIRIQNATSGFRAVSLLMLFLSGWFAAPVKFVIPEPPTCEMECCLVKGSHSCMVRSGSPSTEKDAHHHAGNEVLDDEQTVETTKIGNNAISAPCSTQCGLPASGLQTISVPKTGSPGCSITFDAAQRIYARAPHFARDALVEESHAPRAPPTDLL